ncbi:MAG: hypothetical protein RBQ77_03630 [Candidatus Methanomethylophilaceae archaeon]|nr:hypothetical protein [Candidatus Methanomethylophilaceae archaeon]NLF33535.1 hypothetical protein [Thermoplasmatales archaeon]
MLNAATAAVATATACVLTVSAYFMIRSLRKGGCSGCRNCEGCRRR